MKCGALCWRRFLAAAVLCGGGCSTSEVSPSSGAGAADAADDDAAVRMNVDGSAESSTPVDAATDASRCSPIVATPDIDAWSHRAPGVGFGGIDTEVSGAHTDVFLNSPAVGALAAKYTRIGARLDWGGSIVFFGLGANAASNVIDANDTGRELQIAIYDPTRIRQRCAADASCATSTASCGDSITFLGWNPVQGGDECNHGATVVSNGRAGDALRLVVNPLQWNPDWNRADCTQTACGAAGVPVDVTYSIELRFVTPHVVEVMTEVTSNETFSHPATAQEFPTLYVNHGQGGPDLPLLLDSGGNTVTLAKPGNDGFFHDDFVSPGPWVTWQTAAKNYGVALAMDQGITAFQGWRGDGVNAPYFHNVRAHIVFGLGAGQRVRGLSYLALGDFATVGAQLAEVRKKRPPFGAIDTPLATTAKTYVSGADIAVAGWVLDDAKAAVVQVEVDGFVVATPPVTTARADVCATYPAYPSCPTPGFTASVATSGLSPCPHLLRVVAVDADGNRTTLGEREIRPE